MSNNEQKTLGDMRLTRRGVFRLAVGLVAGRIIGPGKVAAGEPESQSHETETISAWDKRKRLAIDEWFLKETNTKGEDIWKKLIPVGTFAENEVTFERLDEGEMPRLLTAKLHSADIPLDLKCTYRTLINKAVERYAAIVENPYEIQIDPDISEVDQMIAQAAGLTGLPVDFIRTFAWRENGMKGVLPQLHYDNYVPAIGGGFINLEICPLNRLFGQDVTVKDRQYSVSPCVVAKMPGRDGGYVLPITKEAAEKDALLGILLPTAIALEHVEKLMTIDRQNPELVKIRDYFLQYKDEELGVGNIPEDNLAKFTAFAFALYHHGIYRPIDGDDYNPLNFTVVANETLTKIDLRKPETFTFYQTYITALKTTKIYQPWTKERYRLQGKNEASGHEFYCQMAVFIRKHMDDNPQLARLAKELDFNDSRFFYEGDSGIDQIMELFRENPKVLKEVLVFGFLNYFQNNFKYICDINNYSEELQKKLGELFADDNYEIERILANPDQDLRGEIKKLDIFLRLADKIVENFDSLNLNDIGSQDALKREISRLSSYYFTWSDDQCSLGMIEKLSISLVGEYLPSNYSFDQNEVEINKRIPESEMVFLQKLRYLFDLYPDPFRKSWNRETHPSSWDGVEIKNGHVAGIKVDTRVADIPNVLLRDILSGGVGALTELRALSVRSRFTEEPLDNSSGEYDPIFEGLKNCIRLETLDLEAIGLSGKIPNEIFRMPNIRIINLSFNKLTGGLPEEIGEAELLEVFNISRNNLSGRLPESTGRLKNLTEFDIRHNDFGGSLPETIFGLANLTVLNIGANKFTGQISPKIGNLKKLEGLYASNNLFEGPIPHEIGLCQGLTDLSLGTYRGEIYSDDNVILDGRRRSAISGEIPQEIYNLSSLSNLTIKGTEMKFSISADIGKLVNLRWLDLTDNPYMYGSIPAEITKCRKLDSFSIGYCADDKGKLIKCPVEGEIPTGMFGIETLTRLEIGGTNITGHLPEEIGNSNLSSIKLGYNELSGRLPRTLLDLELEDLQIPGNHFTGEIPDNLFAFQEWSRLRTVVLDGNEFTGSFRPSDPEGLYKLSIRGCRLTVYLAPYLVERLNSSEMRFVGGHGGWEYFLTYDFRGNYIIVDPSGPDLISLHREEEVES